MTRISPWRDRHLYASFFLKKLDLVDSVELAEIEIFLDLYSRSRPCSDFNLYWRAVDWFFFFFASIVPPLASNCTIDI